MDFTHPHRAKTEPSKDQKLFHVGILQGEALFFFLWGFQEHHYS